MFRLPRLSESSLHVPLLLSGDVIASVAAPVVIVATAAVHATVAVASASVADHGGRRVDDATAAAVAPARKERESLACRFLMCKMFYQT